MPSADSTAAPPSLTPSKPFSLSLSSTRPPGKSTLKPNVSASQSASLAQGCKRPYSALADPESEPEDDTSGRHEAVVGFGHDGKAISVADANGKKQPMVIRAEKSGRDWREETRRRRGKKNLLPAEAQAQQYGQMGDMGTVDRVEVSTVGGLKIADTRVDGEGDTTMGNGQADIEKEQTEGGEKKQMTADEEAVAALLGQRKKATLTISAAEGQAGEANGHDMDEGSSEADRFRADVDSRPLPASLADYTAVPVEEFGAAILRGLGWKEGEAVGKRGQAATAPREVKRRPALLGLGAKETPGGVSGEELGAWNQKKGRGKEKVAYNPLMLRNSLTGEMVTEEELELRKLEAKQGKRDKDDDWRERRDRNLKSNDGKQSGRLAIENGIARSGSGSSLQDGSKDRDRRRDKDRRRDRGNDSSRRERSRSWEWSSKDGSSRRERDRSKERRDRGKYDDNGRRHRDTGPRRRDEDRDNERRPRDGDYDHRGHPRKQKRH